MFDELGIGEVLDQATQQDPQQRDLTVGEAVKAMVLNEQGATFPNQTGKRIHNPTARWVFHYFVGMHLLCQVGQWPLVLNLTEEHCNLLKLLGYPYMRLYDVKYS